MMKTAKIRFDLNKDRGNSLYKSIAYIPRTWKEYFAPNHYWQDYEMDKFITYIQEQPMFFSGRLMTVINHKLNNKKNVTERRRLIHFREKIQGTTMDTDKHKIELVNSMTGGGRRRGTRRRGGRRGGVARPRPGLYIRTPKGNIDKMRRKRIDAWMGLASRIKDLIVPVLNRMQLRLTALEKRGPRKRGARRKGHRKKRTIASSSSMDDIISNVARGGPPRKSYPLRNRLRAGTGRRRRGRRRRRRGGFSFSKLLKRGAKSALGFGKTMLKQQLTRLPQYMDDLGTKGFKGVLSDVGSNLLSDAKGEIKSRASRMGQGRRRRRRGGFSLKGMLKRGAKSALGFGKTMLKQQMKRIPQYIDDLGTKGFKGVLSDVGSNLLSDAKGEIKSRVSRMGQGRRRYRKKRLGRRRRRKGGSFAALIPMLASALPSIIQAFQ